MHRLHVAATVGGERGVEAEVVQAGAACDATKLSRVEGAGLALANRCLQSRVLLRGKAAAIVLRFDQADGGASQHRERQDQGRDRATTRHYAARRGDGLRPRPAFLGLHSGLHFPRPSRNAEGATVREHD